MKLYIMRHGPAEDESASGRDFDRALTPSGRERVMSVARTLADADEAPLSIVSSPLVRALQTAEIVAAATKLVDRGGSVETRREITPGGDATALIDELRREKRRRAMLVGHEPDLSGLVSRLIGAQLPLGMLKAMVVAVSITDDGTRLRFILDPKTLELTRS
jgi:phosphohistidine phosphatase